MPRALERLRHVRQALGGVGITFLITLALSLIFYFIGQGGLLFLDILFLIPFGIILAVRGFRRAKRRPLWSLRNRLLFVYRLFGVLPVLLLFVLFGLATWGVTSELAIYLAATLNYDPIKIGDTRGLFIPNLSSFRLADQLGISFGSLAISTFVNSHLGWQSGFSERRLSR